MDTESQWRGKYGKVPYVHSSAAKLILLLRHGGWIYSFHDGNWDNAKNFLSSNYANAVNDGESSGARKIRKMPSVHSSTSKLLLLLRHGGWIYSFHYGNWGNAKNSLSSNYANMVNEGSLSK
jgi:hypothetical protein